MACCMWTLAGAMYLCEASTAGICGGTGMVACPTSSRRVQPASSCKDSRSVQQWYANNKQMVNKRLSMQATLYTVLVDRGRA
eukprot:326031-Amphidinium_carterae.3